MRVSLGVYGLLFAVITVLFSPFLLGGRVFVPADILEFLYPWRTGQPVHNLELLDVALLFYPDDCFLNAQLKAGELPLWNPHRFCGYPWVASGQSALLYWPRNFFHWLLSPGAARSLTIYLHLLAMAFGMTFWLRSRGLSLWSAGLGGLVWSCNAWMMAIMEYEHAIVIGAYLAPAFYCLDRFLESFALRWWCGLALCCGIFLTAGHLHLGLVQGVLLAAYGLIRVRHWRVFLALVFCALAALTVACSTLLPFLELMSQGQRGALILRDNAASLLSLLASLLSADLFGNPTHNFLMNRSTAHLVFNEFACYFGIVPLLLALTAMNRRSFWAWAALFCLLAAAATPPYVALTWAVPTLGKLIPGRSLHAFVFCAAVLAAEGAERWDVRRLRGLSVCVLALWAGFLAVLALLLFGFPERAATLVAPFANGLYWKLPPLDSPEAEPAGLVALARSHYFGHVTMYLPLLMGGFLLWMTRRAAVGVLLCLVTAFDLVPWAMEFNTTVSRLYAPTPAISRLVAQTGLFRVEKRSCAFYNSLIAYGIQLFSGYDSVIPARYFQTIAAIEPGRNMRMISLRNLEQPLLDAANVMFAMVAPFEELASARWEKIYDGEVKLYRNRLALPRAYVVGRARSFDGFAAALASLNAFDPRREAILEFPAPGVLEESATGSPVRILAYGPDRVVLDVEMQGAGILVLADSWYPGWTCRVNGVRSDVFPVNAILRGVYLPKGTMRAEFDFRPRRWEFLWPAGWGAVVLLTLGLVIGKRHP